MIADHICPPSEKLSEIQKGKRQKSTALPTDPSSTAASIA
jgi:hypothetical protein